MRSYRTNIHIIPACLKVQLVNRFHTIPQQTLVEDHSEPEADQTDTTPDDVQEAIRHVGGIPVGLVLLQAVAE